MDSYPAIRSRGCVICIFKKRNSSRNPPKLAVWVWFALLSVALALATLAMYPDQELSFSDFLMFVMVVGVAPAVTLTASIRMQERVTRFAAIIALLSIFPTIVIWNGLRLLDKNATRYIASTESEQQYAQSIRNIKQAEFNIQRI